MSISEILVGVGALLTVLFTQYNARKAVRETREAVALSNKETKEAVALAAKESRGAIAEQNKALAAQSETLASVSKNVDGNLSIVKGIADKFEAEVGRLHAGGSPTPIGEPTAENPVTISETGVPTVATPSRAPAAPAA